jgi:6-phosphogluconolactonase
MKTWAISILALCLGLTVLAARAQAPAGTLVYVGTRGSAAPAGPKQGIYALRLNERTGALTSLGVQAEVDRAQYIALHPTLPVLYSVTTPGGGIGDSGVRAFGLNRTSGALTPMNTTGSGGKDATYLNVDPASRTLFVANHNGGDVSAVALDAAGDVDKVSSRQTTFGSGPHARQKMPQAHSVLLDPSGKFVLAADLGADRVFVYRFDPATRALTPADPPSEATAPGSGPRHMLFHPNGKFLFLDTQISAGLIVYAWDAQRGRLNPVHSLSLYPAGYKGNEAEKDAGDIRISGDGRFLYVSLRADQNSIVVLSVNQNTGMVKEVQRIGAQGTSPRGLALSPSGRWMLVGNDLSNEVAVMRVDPATGKLSATGVTTPIPVPSSIVFAQ